MWSHFEKGKWLCLSCLGLFAMESWFVVKGFSMLVWSQGNSFVCLWCDAAVLNWLCVICLLGKVIFVLVVLSILDLSLISAKSSRHATILNSSCVLLVTRNFCFLLDRGLIYSTPFFSIMPFVKWSNFLFFCLARRKLFEVFVVRGESRLCRDFSKAWFASGGNRGDCRVE